MDGPVLSGSQWRRNQLQSEFSPRRKTAQPCCRGEFSAS